MYIFYVFYNYNYFPWKKEHNLLHQDLLLSLRNSSLSSLSFCILINSLHLLTFQIPIFNSPHNNYFRDSIIQHFTFFAKKSKVNSRNFTYDGPT